MSTLVTWWCEHCEVGGQRYLTTGDHFTHTHFVSSPYWPWGREREGLPRR